ncbi:MAG: YebC/PmpR family DNA-binding transcriptional regulator [Eubacteriaceae bacterium]|nr:YebC/PmpR family DNA-binding transcriptional regulator [Eubacteriaceae bacterium]
MAGHSKWANIKHKKGRQDAIKGKVYTKIGKLISVAVKEGGPDPGTNMRLKEAIAKAKANNMPNDNIDRAIKKGVGELGGRQFENITYEGYGVGGIAVIVETLTDNKNRTAGDVRYIFDKNGGNLGTSGCVSYLFNRQGVILVSPSPDISEDALMELALDAGASDFDSDEEGYALTAEPELFSDLLAAVENAGIKPVSAEIAMNPTTETAIEDPEQLKKFLKMLDMFDDNDDVNDVYHNAILPDEDED